MKIVTTKYVEMSVLGKRKERKELDDDDDDDGIYTVNPSLVKLFETKDSGIPVQGFKRNLPVNVMIVGGTKTGKSVLAGTMACDPNSPFYLRFPRVMHYGQTLDKGTFPDDFSKPYTSYFTYDNDVKGLKSKQKTLIFDDFPLDNKLVISTVEKSAQMNRNNGLTNNIINTQSILPLIKSGFPQVQANLDAVFFPHKNVHQFAAHSRKLASTLGIEQSQLTRIFNNMKGSDVERNLFTRINKGDPKEMVIEIPSVHTPSKDVNGRPESMQDKIARALQRIEEMDDELPPEEHETLTL